MNQQSVRLMHHDSRWRQEFLQTRSSILMACDGRVTEVCHVGSTAIAGLIAEPIIDVVALVADAESFPDAQACIEGLNYRLADRVHWASDVVALTKSSSGQPTHRVFLMAQQNPAAEQMKKVNQRIETDTDLCSRLENAKVHHWRTYEGDRRRYEQAKSIFFTHLLDQMEATA